jgi:hypothetical protein
MFGESKINNVYTLASNNQIFHKNANTHALSFKAMKQLIASRPKTTRLGTDTLGSN